MCRQAGCAFKLNVFMKRDERFYITKESEHTCGSFNPTIKKAWVLSKVVELVKERPKVKVPELTDFFRVTFGLDVHIPTIRDALSEARKCFDGPEK